MKKVKVLVCMMLLSSALVACGEKGDTKKTTVCTGVMEGIDEKMTFESNGDKIEKQIEEFSAPLADLGIEEKDMDTLMATLLKEVFGSEDGEGIEGKYEVKDGVAYFTLTVDYTKVDFKKLEEAGFMEKGLITTKYVSLEKSIKSYEEQGLTCK